MVQLRQSVRVGATIDSDPGAVLRIVNETLLLDRGDAIATAFVGTIAPDSQTLRVRVAGHRRRFCAVTTPRCSRSPVLAAARHSIRTYLRYRIDRHRQAGNAGNVYRRRHRVDAAMRLRGNARFARCLGALLSTFAAIRRALSSARWT